MNKTYVSIYLLIASVVTPVLTAAQVGNANGILSWIMNLIQMLLGLIMAASVLIFFWGLALFILDAGNSDGQAKGRSLMIWGIVALFVMTSVYGLVGFLQNTLGVDNSNRPEIPVLFGT